MKILLDESVPRKLAYDFPKEHEVKTVRDMSWLGKKNGELLKLLVENNFDALLTFDKNLQHQQNLQLKRSLKFAPNVRALTKLGNLLQVQPRWKCCLKS